MVSVTIPHGIRDRAGGLGLHVTCGAVGLVVAVAAVAAWVPAIAEPVSRAFGLLSTTTIVLSLLVCWLVLWIGMEVAVDRLSE
jgi:hypothetical protein